MNSQKNNYNYIENKIRSFKEGVDYHFAGEKYHAGNGEYKGYTQRSYQINSPQLQKVVQDYLSQQVAIFMQFEFKGWGCAMEWKRPDGVGKYHEEKYYAGVKDEKGNGLTYDDRENVKGEKGYLLTITFPEEPRRFSPAEFNRRYQVAKQAWEAKGSPLNNTPPKGTKCWNCYEVISEADMVACRYKVDNTRLGKTKGGELTFFKSFEHVKEYGCKPAEYDPAQRNNFQYWNGWIDTWLKTHPQKKHEINCQDCLNRLWNEVNGNLIYLETWAKEQTHEIGLTKQVLAEIKAHLARLKASGQFRNCGIKKCCAEHDRPEISENEKRDLITTDNLEEESLQPKKETFNRQDLLDLMKEKGIVKISRNPQDSEQLLIEYDDGQTENWSIANNFPVEWEKYLKQEISQNPIYLNQSVNRSNQNRWPVGKIVVGGLIFSLVSIIGVLIYQCRKKV